MVYDIQVMQAINALNLGHSKPLSPAMKLVKAFKRVSIEKAIAILGLLGHDDTPFVFDEEKWKMYDWKSQTYFPEYQGRMADETGEFWFWGGPPTRLGWYSGNLQTFLEDRILAEIQLRGLEDIEELLCINV